MMTEGAIIVGRITSKYAENPETILTEADFKNIHVSCQPGSKSGPGPFVSFARLQSDGTYRLRVPAGQSTFAFGWTDWLAGFDSPTRNHYAVWPQSDTQRQMTLEEGESCTFDFNVARADIPNHQRRLTEIPPAAE